MSEPVEPHKAPAPKAPPEPVAVLTNVHKTYRLDQVEVPVLRGLDVLIRPGLFTVILGPSGSGKTTLLNLLGGLDRPEQGEITVAGERLNDLSDDALADFRSEHIGFVFQNFNLLPVLSAYENIEYPLVIAGVPPAKRANRVTKLLAAVGLSDRAKNKPGELSGGQRQRVAIARALVRRPKLVIADEPTANLDSRTGAAILALMRRMQTRYGISFVFSSHDRDLIHAADDLITLNDGVIRSVRRWQLPASLPIPRSTAPVDEDPLGLDTQPLGLDGAPPAAAPASAASVAPNPVSVSVSVSASASASAATLAPASAATAPPPSARPAVAAPPGLAPAGPAPAALRDEDLGAVVVDTVPGALQARDGLPTTGAAAAGTRPWHASPSHWPQRADERAPAAPAPAAGLAVPPPAAVPLQALPGLEVTESPLADGLPGAPDAAHWPTRPPPAPRG